jgi:tetratricopeptide (TPR) repeat protein/transcriptional regulator with XRE-family HTH domain
MERDAIDEGTTFGQWVKQRRKDLDLSRADLAQRANCSVWTLAKIEADAYRPSRAAAQDLLAALALTPAESSDLLRWARAAPGTPWHALANEAMYAAAPATPAAPMPLPRIFPVPAIRHQLRPSVADFVGRRRETAQLVRHLRNAVLSGSGAVISGVQGMGGIGKTELAYHVAHQLRDAFPDAQIVLDLRGSNTAPLSAEQTLQALIHAFTPDAQLPDDLQELQRQYHATLHTRRALILADDARDAAQVRPLLPPMGCALLITSRMRFSLPGMATIDLEQLDTGEAVALLRHICDRLTTADALMIARACGHLPLALRISGGILHSDPALSVAIYLAQLADEQQRLRQLRDPDDPQLDVEASLTLSYIQQDALSQQVFRQLGVLVTGFATPLALAVVETPPNVEVEALLHLLLRRNLVMYDASRGRWRLHDLVRDLARYMLDQAGEADAAWWRYAWAAVRIAQTVDQQYQIGGDATWAALARFDAEQPHIDAARRWAAAHAGTAAGDALLVADALATAEIGDLRYERRHMRIPQLETALSAARRLGDQHGEEVVLNNLGMCYIDMGEAGRGIPYVEQQLAIARATGDQDTEARALNKLGVAYVFLGDPRRAIQALEQQLALARDIEERWMVLRNLGEAYLNLGEGQRALAFLIPALDHARTRGYQWSEAMVLRTLGDVYLTLGEASRAMEFFEQALAIYRALGNRQGEGTGLCQLGRAYLAQGQAQQAIAHSRQALDIAREVGAQHREGYALCLFAVGHAALGDSATAITAFEAALTRFCAIGDRWGEAMGQWELGLFLVRQGEQGRALALLRSAIAYEEQIRHARAAEHAALLVRLEAGEPLPGEAAPTQSQQSDG